MKSHARVRSSRGVVPLVALFLLASHALHAESPIVRAAEETRRKKEAAKERDAGISQDLSAAKKRVYARIKPMTVEVSKALPNRFVLQLSASWCAPCHFQKSWAEDELAHRPGVAYFVLDLGDRGAREILARLGVRRLDEDPIPATYRFEKGSAVDFHRGFDPVAIGKMLDSLGRR